MRFIDLFEIIMHFEYCVNCSLLIKLVLNLNFFLPGRLVWTIFHSLVHKSKSPFNSALWIVVLPNQINLILDVRNQPSCSTICLLALVFLENRANCLLKTVFKQRLIVVLQLTDLISLNLPSLPLLRAN